VSAFTPLNVPLIQAPDQERRPKPAAGAFMYDTYIIETRKGAAGVVVRDGHGFRFFAATHDFNGLEGRVFSTPKEAKAAALRHISSAPLRARTPHRLDLSMQWSS
jgi:hypothetical protein